MILEEQFMERMNDQKRGVAGTFLLIYGGSLLLTTIAHDDKPPSGHPLHPVGTSYESVGAVSGTSEDVQTHFTMVGTPGARVIQVTEPPFVIARPMTEEPMEARGERLAVIANLVERSDFRSPPEVPVRIIKIP